MGAGQVVENNLTLADKTTLLVSVLIISICAITYELVIATLSSYLLGNSVAQFSFTIGLFLFAMGIGSLLSSRIKENELRWFITIEIVIGVAGGFSASILYAVFALADVYYYLAMFTIIMIIGICSGLEIPLLTRIVATREEIGQALANVLSVDYLGALLASLAFPLILLPALGVTLTAFLTGLLNIAVAALNFRQFRAWLTRYWRRQLRLVLLGFAAFMIGGIATAADVNEFFENQLYADRIIYRDQTSYQRIVMTRRANDIRLFLDGNLQFSSMDEYRYHEMLVHPVMSLARSHERIAVLGGGDGMVVREVLKYDNVQEIVLIDLDPAITDLSREHPLLRDLNDDALHDPRVTIINDDAFNYIRDETDLFSVIIIDLPDPNNESLGKLYSEQFYRLVQRRLTPDGVFVTQATSPYFARQAYWSIVETIDEGGFQAIPLHTYVPSFGEWGFVIGIPDAMPTPELRVPDDINLRYLTVGVLTAAQIFDPDINAVAVEVNTLDNPILVRYYERGWQSFN